jgi:hypothetical protein
MILGATERTLIFTRFIEMFHSHVIAVPHVSDESDKCNVIATALSKFSSQIEVTKPFVYR